MSIQTPIRTGLIGAGVFARFAHIPALLSLPDTFQIVAICSRTESSAKAAAALLPYDVDIYNDVDALLARDDIDAVDIVLPIGLLPEAVEKSLAAGKHVLSEKPLAPTVARGREVVDFAGHHPHLVWMVGENWRCAPPMKRAAEIVQKGIIGDMMTAHWAVFTGLAASSPFYGTAWRWDGSYPGGVLLDGGIHQIAGYRMVLGEIVRVSATTAQMREDLPPLDTVSAILEFESGVIGTYTLCAAVSAPGSTFLTIAGNNGFLEVNRGELKFTINGELREHLHFEGRAVDRELEAFAAAILEGTPHENTPVEALQDVAVVEAILEAAQRQTWVAPERVIP